MNIYFSGIGGVALGPLAEMARDAGHTVMGSDPVRSLTVAELEKSGVRVSNDQSGAFLQQCHSERAIDWFVYTAALPADHPELLFAREVGIAHITKRDEFIQELMQAYMQLTWQGSQQISYASGTRLIPGFNFASEVNTGVGTLRVHADRNFAKTASGANQFQSKIYALRMNHNGLPLVYKLSQIPLSFKDLTPGCTSISFQVSARTALVIKALCAQATYQANFGGKSVTSCPVI